MFGGIAFADGQGFLPVFPVAIFELDGDGGADGHALAHAGKNVGGVALDLHAAAAAIALLATPEFAVEEGLVDFQSGGQAGKEGDQSFAVGLSGSEIAQHKRSIVPDAEAGSGFQSGRFRAHVFRRKERGKLDFTEAKGGAERLQLRRRRTLSGFERNPRCIANLLWP